MAGSASRMTLPPSPPSPPSGPPRGTNFSRRKLTQPRAPVAALDEDVDLVDEHGGDPEAPAAAPGADQAGCWAMLTYLSSPLRSKRT